MFKLKLLHLISSSTARDSFASLSGQVIGGVLGAVYYAIAARMLGVELFGILSLSIATASIIKDIIDPAINTALLRFVPGQKDQNTSDSFIKYSALIKLGYFACVIPLFIIFRHQATLIIFKQEYQWILFFTLALSLTYSLGSFISGILQSHRRFVPEAAFAISQPALRLILLLFLIVLNYLNLQSLLVISILATLLTSFIALFFMTTQFIHASISHHTRKHTHKFLPPMIISTATGSLTDRINLYLTNHYSSALQVGLLSSASQLFIPTRQISGSLSNVFAPRFSAFETQSQANQYLKKSLSLCLLLVLGLLSTSIIAHPIILMVYGEAYLASIQIFRLYTVAYSLFLLQVPFSSMLIYFKGRSDTIALLGFFQLIVTVILNVILIPQFQAVGAVISFILVTATSFFIIAALALKSKRIAR